MLVKKSLITASRDRKFFKTSYLKDILIEIGL